LTRRDRTRKGADTRRGAALVGGSDLDGVEVNFGVYDEAVVERGRPHGSEDAG